MANTTKQRRRIGQDLYSRFTHPSPSLKKKWDKRRAEKGSGQDVLDQEYREWVNEGQGLKELKANYKKRLANELWSKQDFRYDVNEARKVYLENIKLPPKQQDEGCMGRPTQELRNKYHLNRGWLLWIAHCIKEWENNPDKLLLYVFRQRDENVKYISLDIYFPLPVEIYEEIIIYLRMQEAEAFGDYYNQEQKGGRSKHSRPQNTIAKYNRIINLRNSAQWRMRTDKEFLDHHTEYNRSELARAKKWEREGKPR